MSLSITPAILTLYAELMQQVETAPAPGSVYRRNLDSGEYIYAKISAGSGRVDRFIGKAGDPKAEQRAQAFQIGSALAQERRRLVSMLKAQGRLASPDRTMGAILEVLAQAELFKSGAVLVGTAAYLVSEPLVGHRLPSPTLMTGDPDLATARVAISSEPPERLEDILRKADKTFEGIPQLDPQAPPSRFRNKNGYLVDLLTPTRTRSDTNPVRLKGLDAGAAPLQYLAWLIEDAVPAIALIGSGVLVRVPQPARFAVHKLILAQRRDAANRIKRTKDLQQAKALILALKAYDPFLLQDTLADARSQGEAGWAQPIQRSLDEIAV